MGVWGTSPVTYYTPVNAVLYSVRQGDPFEAANEALNQTIRMIAHPSMGGSIVRLRFSNAYGTQSVTFDAVHVAKAVSPTSPAIVAATDVPVTFNCGASVTIPVGQEVTSDPINLSFAHGDDIAVTSYIKSASGFITFHSIADQTNYVNAINGGNSLADAMGTTFSQSCTQSFFLTGVDTYAPSSPGTIVALGDSITDGAFIAAGTDARWPDDLANSLDAHGIASPVINEGIAGNTVLRYTATPPDGTYLYGDPATDRFQRDVLDRPNVRTLLVLEGTNDLSYQGEYNSAAGIYAGLVALANRAHAAGIKNVFVATITPRTTLGEGSAGFLPTQQAQLTALNAMIRASTVFDGYMEFHDPLVDPANPRRRRRGARVYGSVLALQIARDLNLKRPQCVEVFGARQLGVLRDHFEHDIGREGFAIAFVGRELREIDERGHGRTDIELIFAIEFEAFDDDELLRFVDRHRDALFLKA